MPNVTQTIPNYLGGVSKQPDTKKLPGQLVECINGYPDPTFGLTKRPGFKFIKGLGNENTLTNAKWFYIHRDGDEKYIGCITPKPSSGNGTIAVWNAATGVACTVTNGSQHAYLTGTNRGNYDVLSVQANTIITNDTVTVTTKAAPTGFVAASRGTILLTGDKIQMQGYTFSVTVAGHTTATYEAAADATYDDILDTLN